MSDSETVTFNIPQIPGYSIVKEIGRGGMAVVYLAVQEVLQRKVALKVVKQSIANDSSFTERFIREARMAASLNHPRILTVHDFGNVKGIHYLVTEYLTGGSLDDRIQDGPIPIDESLGYLLQVSRGLAYAHEHGVIHRDLKPGNIFFREGKNTVIGDFGIAKAVGAGDPALTGVGYMVGTPLYMSPEQIKGKDIDPRSDLYALGIMAYRMIVGEPPFTGNPTNIIFKQLETELPRMPGAPAQVQSLVDTLCAKDRNDRPQNAQAVVLMLEGMLSPEMQTRVSSKPFDWGNYTARLTKPRGAPVVVGVATAVLAIIGLVWALWSPKGPRETADDGIFTEIEQRMSAGEYAKAHELILIASEDGSDARRAESIFRGLPVACLNQANMMAGIGEDLCGAQELLHECMDLFKDNQDLRAAAEKLRRRAPDC